MKIKCAETQSFNEYSKSFKVSIKGMENMISYLKIYVKETKQYVDNMNVIKNKYHAKHKINNNPSTVIDEYFRRLRIIIDSQITSFALLSDLVEKEVFQCEKNIIETIECQKKIKLDAVDAEEDYLTQIKEIEKAKNVYFCDAFTVENFVRNIEKKKRIKSNDDEHQEELQKAIFQMNKAEKDYMKKANKYNMFKQTFFDRIIGSSGSISHLVHGIECKAKDIAYFTMLCLQTSLKQILAEIYSYSPSMEIPLDKPVDKPPDETKDKGVMNYIQEYNYEPYKIKSMIKENQDDFTEEELHNIIKTIIENTIKKNTDYDLIFEEQKIRFNQLIKLLFNFSGYVLLKREEMSFLDNCMKSKHFRDILFQKLNDLRNHGDFSWPKEHYVQIGKVFCMILNAVEKDNDYATVKNTIILSQTFYFKADNEKVYLQVFIQEHPSLQKRQFWENYMLISIENEMKLKLNNTLNVKKKETSIELINKKSNIVFSQLVHITDNMLGFNIPKDVIKSILEEVLKQYPITENHRAMIFSVIGVTESIGNSEQGVVIYKKNNDPQNEIKQKEETPLETDTLELVKEEKN